jgi:hypothetical protein
LLGWVAAATTAPFFYFRVAFGIPIERASELLVTMLWVGSINFAMAVMAGLVLWMLLRRASGRRWQVAVLLGAACYYLIPNVVAALAMLALEPGFDPSVVLIGGLVDMARTLAVGAIVGGVMWRVAYRRVVIPSVSDVFA